MQKRLFGTDGARGTANSKITCEIATKMGMAGVHVLAGSCKKAPRIIIGTDTRKSKDMLSYALAAGVAACGGTAIMVGVTPTPSIPIIAYELKADAAVMISASHNPMSDNGIKWFQSNGMKLSDETELKIESFIFDGMQFELPTGEAIGEIITNTDAVDIYTKFLESKISDLSGMHIALDCANGAASDIAPRVFCKAGAKLEVIGNTPDGCNINRGCGSTHLEPLCELVTKSHSIAGFALDGDADRMLAVDEFGNEINGDIIMGICALYLNEHGKLKDSTLVATSLSNIGFENSLAQRGITLLRSDVGDRYVLEMLRKHNLNFGGEQSGHYIFFDYNTTGDGTLSAIMLANIMNETGKTLSELAREITLIPQEMISVLVFDINAAMNDEEFAAAITEKEKQLAGVGRILIRKSGTEPKIRIMVEGKDRDVILGIINDLAELLRRKFGQNN